MKTEIVEIAGIRCTLCTERRSVRVGNAGKATRRTQITILAGGREIATASTRKTALERARTALAGEPAR